MADGVGSYSERRLKLGDVMEGGVGVIKNLSRNNLKGTFGRKKS